MEKVWQKDSPHAKFFRQLMNNRVDELINSKDWLQRLRYNHEEVRWWNKRAGYIFEERGINLYQLIAQSHGECWDAEDEEKHAGVHNHPENVVRPVLKKKPRQNALSLDHPLQGSVRRREEEKCELQVLPSDEGRKINLQEGGR
jgi:hypothetical protein